MTTAGKRPNKREKFAAGAAAKESSVKQKSEMQVPSWWAWLPVILGFLVYANTLGHEFALDDYAAILENASTKKGVSAIGEIFSHSYRHGYIIMGDELYRPLPKALFAVCWSLAPNSATPGHWLNVLLFAFTCYFLFRFTTHWFPSDKRLALIASSLFAVHPIHTEVVANIKSLDEILSFLLGMMSLHLFLLFVQKGGVKYILSAMLCFFGAYLSKESSITFLALFPLFAWFTSAGSMNRVWSGLAWMLVPTVLFFLIRYQIIYAGKMIQPAPPSVADNMLSAAKDPLTRFSGAVAMLGLYLWKIVVPVGLSFDLSYPQVTPAKVSDISFLLSVTVMVSLLVFALKGWKSRQFFSLAILMFFVLVSVSSNVFMLIGTHYGERLMYAPSFALLLLAGWAILKVFRADAVSANKIPMPVMGLTALLVLVFSGLTIARNPVWKNNQSLYLSGLTSAPNSARVHYYQGLWLNKPENIELFPAASRDSATQAGIMHLKKSVELYAPFTDAWTQLGVSSYRQKKYAEAIGYYEQGLKYSPYDPVVLNNMGSIYFEQQKFNEALKLYLEAVKYKPDYADALMNIGSCYGVGQQYDLAIQYLEKAVAVDPGLSQAYYFIGITYRNKGNEALAQQYIQRSQQVAAAKNAK